MPWRRQAKLERVLLLLLLFKTEISLFAKEKILLARNKIRLLLVAFGCIKNLEKKQGNIIECILNCLILQLWLLGIYAVICTSHKEYLGFSPNTIPYTLHLLDSLSCLLYFASYGPLPQCISLCQHPIS